MRVYVLLYNPGTDNEGIHTLKAGDRDFVLMFQSQDDATRFALMLEAQDFPSPTVEEMDSEEIEEFCRSVGYEAQFIQAGELLTPPETNLEKTDWSPQGQPQPVEPEAEATSEISDLDEIRRRLEKLL